LIPGEPPELLTYVKFFDENSSEARVANTYSTNHELIVSEGTGATQSVVLHMEDALGLMRAWCFPSRLCCSTDTDTFVPPRLERFKL
jgi:hypothetical protein